MSGHPNVSCIFTPCPTPCPAPPTSYATVYTMAPVFSLVLDEDVTPEDALDFPELYKDLMKVWGGVGWGGVGECDSVIVVLFPCTLVPGKISVLQNVLFMDFN